MDVDFCVIMIVLCYSNIKAVFGSCRNPLSETFYDNYRISNYTFLSIQNIGIQACISECLTRPLCKSVNFHKMQLICELLSVADANHMTQMTGFTLVNLSREIHKDGTCSPQCLVGEQCIAFSNNKKSCVDDYTISGAKDCSDVRTFGKNFHSGIYLIRVSGKGWLNVYCDMDTDNGGWLVIQRRFDGATDFHQNWNKYKTGFGNLSAEFWLGNDALHYILQQGQYELRMDMSDFDNATRYVKYQNINIGDETSGYLMSISGYSGNVADCFTTSRGINNRRFTTTDRDNDRWGSNCAVNYKGGWWYNSCHCANPNGYYLAGQNRQHGQGITYDAWRTHYYSLKTVKLMIRRK